MGFNKWNKINDKQYNNLTSPKKTEGEGEGWSVKEEGWRMKIFEWVIGEGVGAIENLRSYMMGGGSQMAKIMMTSFVYGSNVNTILRHNTAQTTKEHDSRSTHKDNEKFSTDIVFCNLLDT